MGRNCFLSFQFLSFLSFVYFSIFLPTFGLNIETRALLQLKKQLKDPLNVLESWKESDSPCNFSGINCDPITGKVTTIALDNKSLSGEISNSISELKSLTTLSLSSNYLSGKLPQEIVNCSNLRLLNLSVNHMVGVLPDLSSLKKFEILDLALNYFSGRFPTWVGNLTGLTILSIGQNEYDECQIPESIGNLKNLTLLFLADCHLSGEIPESISQLTNLETFDMSRNKISGEFPKSISKLQKLSKIEFFHNNLTGEIPQELANLTLLREFDVSSNQMYGKIPEGIGNLKNLVVFQLYDNFFHGELPAGFGDMKNLDGFSIYGNKFSGEFPANFGRFSPLKSFDISENQFSGSFPKYLCEGRKLQYLLALGNNFSGEFPDSYAECKSLERFRINKNKMTGQFPDEFWALPLVTILDCSDNDFTGHISPKIGLSTSLTQLILRNNRFSGKLPSELGKLMNLQKLYLNNNGFSGEIPSDIGALKQLTSLHLEENSFTGPIPSKLSHCTRLVDLDLASNSLNGPIPQDISSMSSLNTLNLSQNKLTGLIPEDIGKLMLSSIDLTANQLSGRIPSVLLNMGGDKAFMGNNELCIDENSKTVMNSELNVCAKKNSQERTLGDKSVLLSTIISALVIVLAGLLLVSYRNFKNAEMDLEGQKDPKWKLASFDKLDIDADEICKLKEENLIGSGGTGKVYRLDLKRLGCTVAVKQLWKGDGLKLLAAEMEILGKIRHRHILKLYASLLKGGSSFLVFEYMANGNLSEALHRRTKDEKPELDWRQRYKIALGAAKGIAYLHHDCCPPIIHRDIKSSNILLDEDYEPKIADFGVAKLAKMSSSKSCDSSCLAGTHGYIAPEMAYTLKVTEKNDVYSLGVVLLELVTGRRAIEDAYGEGKDIVYWVWTHLNNRKNVLKVLDEKISSESVQEDMIKVLKIAILCTTKLPNLRPTMREVVKMLVDADPCSFRSPDNNLDKNDKLFL
ncbi:hypothetical protein JCGZ_14857 [Jatropha curcas]|uniref:Protein kinase domain-containing protein n=1 Tax=Jatropha curcas TaxID=180498 RepID=A0A067K670_JATCU|nr:receptor protein-tyrosine kinase CEPR2 [Jatropha curcas]KDP31632.1 hypothetical protein JCGZ_14857 [Jatropha curcas]